tara:strand:- start:2565 stop:4916 length:2352 start_codon:yes stop_codon:yes gene_type:complete
MANSAINIPTSIAGMAPLISGNDQYYYIAPDSTTGDGTEGSPFPNLTDAFNKIENSRIAKDVNVYFVIKSANGATGWNQHIVDDSTITCRHPDADRIIIKGETPTTVTPYAISYYDSVWRGMGSLTGGYLMEMIVSDGSATNVEVGDFFRISDDNYSSTSHYVTGLSGPTFLETDFAHYRSGVTLGYDISGNTYDASPLSLRKTLMLGCHEVVGVDFNSGDSVDSQTILLHVRHTNPTHSLNYMDGNSLTGASAGYVTPQGLVFNKTNTYFPTGKKPADGTTTGFILGNEYRGITAHRLSNEVWPNAVTTTLLPTSAGGERVGYTAGATGAYGGWTAGRYADTEYTQASSNGSTNGGVSGGNGYWWDISPCAADNPGVTAAYGGLKVKHIPSRIYFQAGSGLKLSNNSRLGKIQDLVICGPGFATYATTALKTDGSIGVHADSGAGLLSTSNVSVVGFDQGFRSEDNSYVNADGAMASNCRKGFVADQNSHMRANHTIASGCNIGYYALNQSHIDGDYTISVANTDDGFYCANNSSINAKGSLSCLNGGYGFSAVDSSTLRLTKQTSVKDEYNETLKTGTGEAYRYASSDKTGAFGFRNTKSGVFAESSTVYAANSRMSYNQESGYVAFNNATIDAWRANAWFNGFTGASQTTDYDWQGSGFAAVHGSKIITGGALSKWNWQDGFYIIDGSYMVGGSCTADNNARGYAFRAIYDSTILCDGCVGRTADGVAGAGSSGPNPSGTGFYANKDSLIFVGDGAFDNDANDSGRGFTGVANAGLIRHY